MPVNDVLRMARSPGKFEGEMLVNQMLWEASLEWGELGIGDVQDFGYFQRHDFDESFVDDLEKSQGKLNPAERAFLRKQVGAITSEDNFGFVTVGWFESKKALDNIWDEIEDAYGQFYEGSERED